jgi:hypothetical protein
MDEDLGEFKQAWTEFRRCGELARGRLKTKRDVQSLSALALASERIATAAQDLAAPGGTARAGRG